MMITLAQLQRQTNLLGKYKQNHRPTKLELITLIKHDQGRCFAEMKSALAVCICIMDSKAHIFPIWNIYTPTVV